MFCYVTQHKLNNINVFHEKSPAGRNWIWCVGGRRMSLLGARVLLSPALARLRGERLYQSHESSSILINSTLYNVCYTYLFVSPLLLLTRYCRSRWVIFFKDSLVYNAVFNNIISVSLPDENVSNLKRETVSNILDMNSTVLKKNVILIKKRPEYQQIKAGY